MSAKSLWGGLEDIDTVRTPSMILQEQAGLLGELTNEVLEGQVGRDIVQDDNRIVVSLYIVAPAIQRYRVQILSLNYSYATAYPVRVSDSIRRSFTQAKTEDELLSILKGILSSSHVKNVIVTLISESRVSSPN